MSQIEFFLDPQELFKVLENIRHTQTINIIFRRFASNSLDSSFRTLHEGENPCEIYLSDRYSEIYLSVGALPTNNKDWDFLNRSADDLIILQGGRLQDSTLEMCKARLISKASKAKNIFKILKKSIMSVSDKRGLHTKTGQFYKKIYYQSTLLSYELRFSLDENRESFIYVE